MLIRQDVSATISHSLWVIRLVYYQNTLIMSPHMVDVQAEGLDIKIAIGVFGTKSIPSS